MKHRSDESRERDRLIRKAYTSALTALRQKYDDEFQSMLADEYVALGLEVQKRTSRVASRHAVPVKKEGK
jgi:hypothetical protein